MPGEEAIIIEVEHRMMSFVVGGNSGEAKPGREILFRLDRHVGLARAVIVERQQDARPAPPRSKDVPRCGGRRVRL